MVLLPSPLCQPGAHGADWEHLGFEHGAEDYRRLRK